MPRLTIDFPDSLFSELQQVASLRHVSTESLLVEITQQGLWQIQTEQHFHERAARGNPKRGLRLLEEIARRSGQG